MVIDAEHLTFSESDWPEMPEQSRPVLQRKLAQTDPELHPSIHAAWIRLIQVLGTSPHSMGDLLEESVEVSMIKDLQYRYVLMVEKEQPGLPAHELNAELTYAHLLLQVLGLQNIPELILERHSGARQSFPDPFVEEYKLACDLKSQLCALLLAIFNREAEPLKNAKEHVGALALALILDAGVLSLDELKVAVVCAYNQPIRAIRDQYYFYFRLSESQSVVQEYRRLHLTPLCTALILGRPDLKPDENHPDIKSAIAAIGLRLGYRSKNQLRVKKLLKGAAVRMRLQETVPQFVVDYAERNLQSHSVRESVWRRLMEVAPWPDHWLPEASNSRTNSEPMPEVRPTRQRPKLPVLERGTINQVRQGLEAAHDSADHLESVRQIRQRLAEEPDIQPIMLTLLDWLEALHTQRARNGQFLRPNSIRNIWTSIASRLILIFGDRPIEELDTQDLDLIIEQLTDEMVSPRQRGSMLYALNLFITWYHETQPSGPPPPKIDHGRVASNVNATIFSPSEIQRIAADLMADHNLSGNSAEERQFHLNILAMGFRLGARKQEMLGLTPGEFHFGNNPSVEIRDNPLRRLKTQASRRRTPLGLIREDFVTDRVQPLALGQDENESIFKPLTETASVDTMMRKLALKLRMATDDEHTSLHALRHSAATWTLLSLHVTDLQLNRFATQWPFLGATLKYESKARSVLLGRRGNLHSLHAVRNLLGHRHESMTALHYIHCMDWMRYAAVTLMDPIQDTGALLAASGISRHAAGVRKAVERKMSPEEAIRLIEGRRPDRVKRHDEPIVMTVDQELGRKMQDAQVLRQWMPNSLDKHDPTKEQAMVTLINKHRLLGKKTLKALDDIRPGHRAALTLALGISEAVSDPDLREFDHAVMVRELLEKHFSRGRGKYRYKLDEAEAPLAWLSVIGKRAHFALRLEYEKSRRLKGGKLERKILGAKSLDEVVNAGAPQVLLVPTWTHAGKRKTFPHEAFVWGMAKLACHGG